MSFFEYGARSDVDPGTYEVTVVAVTKDFIPGEYITQGRNAGQDAPIFRWTFATEDGAEVEGTTGRDPQSAKSKLFNFLTALLGPDREAWKAIKDETDLVGRQALATVALDKGGYSKVEALTAKPTRRLAAAPAPEPVAAGAVQDDLPF